MRQMNLFCVDLAESMYIKHCLLQMDVVFKPLSKQKEEVIKFWEDMANHVREVLDEERKRNNT